MRRLEAITRCCAPWVVLAACGAGGQGPVDAAATLPVADAAPAPADRPARTWSFTPSNLPPAALDGAPAEELVLDPAHCGGAVEVEIDTDALAVVGCAAAPLVRVAQGDGSEVALLLVRSVEIAPMMLVSVRGRLPLVIAATDRVRVAGVVRAAAQREQAGAGGFPGPEDAKGNGRGPGAGAGEARGGGGGGSHCGRGGRGGLNGSGEPGNPPGERYGDARVVPLVGGSSGGNGGNWYAGGGGGALQVVAGRSIELAATGAIHAGGGGGEQEGGGGGSGGAILLEAPSVVVAGVLAANGGGGGSGGKFGWDATPDDQRAPGGEVQRMNTGEGGAGAAGSELDGEDGKPNPTFANGDFSGGGGGGAGYLRINARDPRVTGKLSPWFGTACATQGPLAP